MLLIAKVEYWHVSLSRVGPGIDILFFISGSIPLTRNASIQFIQPYAHTQGKTKSLAMYTFQLKSHRPGAIARNANTFYVLSKGNNSGRPLDEPCPNCFSINTASPEDRKILYWTCYMLWQGGLIRRLLVGSVIPFVRIGELQCAIEQALETLAKDQRAFHKTIAMLGQIDQLECNLRQQLSHVRETKALVVRSLLCKGT